MPHFIVLEDAEEFIQDTNLKKDFQLTQLQFWDKISKFGYLYKQMHTPISVEF